MKAGRPPCWRVSVRMSGVFGQRLGRKKSRTGCVVSSVKYSCSSYFSWRNRKAELQEHFTELTTHPVTYACNRKAALQVDFSGRGVSWVTNYCRSAVRLLQ